MLPMTDLLQQAFDQARDLPADEQDRLAAWLIRELREERRWDESFARSQDSLASLADRALTEHREGKAEPLGEEGQ